ncbi:ABC transporter substrate-binding protein [Ancylobacter defluvii]|uniref:ABC transporter substrate-binding protein n=1 Tax=Ancylobacter defluvii TaxID=1282440 RepID=A0A9W6NAQ1_9HYPH|nr:ABC transporter substrate-binding protein [Ancylobacter defluvii]MBS7588522.1 ABC transporter substrate-binding protein [Ancylobacter defluvii]GLK83802.1 ABC transporter substrate-binding protein [Ancylobacter defluvii]
MSNDMGKIRIMPGAGNHGHGGISRRDLMKSAAALGLVAGAGGLLMPGAARADEPKKGGQLRAGILGATTNTNDPALRQDEFGVMAAYTTYNHLVELNPDKTIKPELAESWEAKPGATEWIFNIRKGVEFHNGKTLTADDVIYSINRHRGEKSQSGAKSLMAAIADIKKLDANQIQVTLKSANADFPYNFTGDHMAITPDGFEDWMKPVGTGGYKQTSFEPGVRATWVHNKNYWKPGRAHVEEVEFLVLNDTQARIAALQSGQIDALGLVDPAAVEMLKGNAGVQVVNSSGGQFWSYALNCKKGPFTDPNLREAMKHAIDRKKILDIVLRGNGKIGNDQPLATTDPMFNPDLAQTPYDPEKAKFFLKKAGMESFKIELNTSDATFANSANVGQLYRQAALPAGITIDVVRQPADGYWDQIWLNVDKPMTTGVWMGRPTADMIMSMVYASAAPWNESFWSNARFDELLVQARGELDAGKRKAMYGELQTLIHDNAGHVVPVFADFIDAYSPRVKGLMPTPSWYLMGARFTERVWLEG